MIPPIPTTYGFFVVFMTLSRSAADPFKYDGRGITLVSLRLHWWYKKEIQAGEGIQVSEGVIDCRADRRFGS